MIFAELKELKNFAAANYELIRNSIVPYISRKEYYSSEYYTPEPFYFERNRCKPGHLVKDAEQTMEKLASAKKELDEAGMEINRKFDELRKQGDMNRLKEVMEQMHSFALGANSKYRELIAGFSKKEIPEILYGLDEAGRVIFEEVFRSGGETESYYDYRDDSVIIHTYKKENMKLVRTNCYGFENNVLCFSIFSGEEIEFQTEYLYENNTLVKVREIPLNEKTKRNHEYIYTYRNKVLDKIEDTRGGIFYTRVKIRKLPVFLEDVRKKIIAGISKEFAGLDAGQIHSIGFFYNDDSFAGCYPYCNYLLAGDVERLKPGLAGNDSFLSDPVEWPNSIDYSLPVKLCTETDYQYESIWENPGKLKEVYCQAAKELKRLLIESGAAPDIRFVIDDLVDETRTIL